jgi:hypothetical protein
MKQKEKVEILKKVANECNPEQEAFFSIYATHKKGDYFAIGDMDLIHRGVYEILKKGIAGEEDDPKTAIAWSILEALKDLQDEGIDINELLTAFDEDDEPDDCLDCELFSKCQNERAKAWRTILETN